MIIKLIQPKMQMRPMDTGRPICCLIFFTANLAN